MTYQGVNVVVLGATGFIGRWVARLLSQRGARLSMLVRDPVIAQEVFAFYDIRGTVYTVDLTDFDCLSNVIQKIKPCILFNLAGYGVNHEERDEVRAYRINSEMIGILCRSRSYPRDLSWSGQDIIHVGTAMEYGNISGNLREDSLTMPITIYGKSKLAGTKLLSQCSISCEIHALTARLFTVYGPGESAGRLLPSLIRATETGEPLELTSGLHQRDFVYVEDVAEALLQLGEAQAPPGDVLNVATGKLTTIKVFAETAARIMGMDLDRLKFGMLPTREEEMKHGPVTNCKLEKLLGWVPQTDITTGIHKTLEFKLNH